MIVTVVRLAHRTGRALSLVLMVGLAGLAGCSSNEMVSAMLPSTDQFVSLEEHPAIKYEPGSEPLARKISPYLDAGVGTIERRQYGAFPQPVVVYVPASVQRFGSFCLSDAPIACVIAGQLFMSPRLLEQPERIQPVLVHELSHLQLQQIIGAWGYQTRLPSWFVEGLAVFVSDGGAEKVSREQALAAIEEGRTFVPDGSGSLFFQRHASNFGLRPQMFYRQAAMLVAWLHAHDALRFEQLIGLLWRGDTLEQAMRRSYGFGVAVAWEQFVDEAGSAKGA